MARPLSGLLYVNGRLLLILMYARVLFSTLFARLRVVQVISLMVMCLTRQGLSDTLNCDIRGHAIITCRRRHTTN